MVAATLAFVSSLSVVFLLELSLSLDVDGFWVNVDDVLVDVGALSVLSDDGPLLLSRLAARLAAEYIEFELRNGFVVRNSLINAYCFGSNEYLYESYFCFHPIDSFQISLQFRFV